MGFYIGAILGNFVLLQTHAYCVSPVSKQKPFGQQCFHTVCSKVLSSDIRHIQSFHTFKPALKTHLCKQYQNRWFKFCSPLQTVPRQVIQILFTSTNSTTTGDSNSVDLYKQYHDRWFKFCWPLQTVPRQVIQIMLTSVNSTTTGDSNYVDLCKQYHNRWFKFCSPLQTVPQQVIQILFTSVNSTTTGDSNSVHLCKQYHNRWFKFCSPL